MPTINQWTLSDWIAEFQNETNRVNLYTLKTIISDGDTSMLFSDESTLSKYHGEFEQYIVSERYTAREREFYAYNPRLFAYDMYGIPEMWFWVRFADEMHTALQFHGDRVKFYQPGIVNLLQIIREIEKPRTDANAQDISDIIVNRREYNNDLRIVTHY